MNGDIKLTNAIFNIDQINYYSENGAMVRHAGIKYCEDAEKPLFYVNYELNDIYLKLKDNWMRFKR